LPNEEVVVTMRAMSNRSPRSAHASILLVAALVAFLGFAVALVIATPLGLLVAKVKVVRAAIGPLLQGLQSLPSVAWVLRRCSGSG